MSILIKQIFFFSNLDFKNYYSTKFIILSEIFSTFFTLAIYYFTAKAFIPKVGLSQEGFKIGYFTYLLIGELFLRIPQSLFYDTTLKMKFSIIDGTYFTLRQFNQTPQKICRNFSLSIIPREMLVFSSTLLVAVIFFDFKIETISFLQAFLLQITSFGAFIGMGMLGSAMILLIGKGEGIINYLSQISMVLAGIYFPVQVFPSWFSSITEYITPYGTLLITTRRVLEHSITTKEYLLSLISLTGWSIIFICLGVYTLKLVQTRNKKTGNKVALTF